MNEGNYFTGQKMATPSDPSLSEAEKTEISTDISSENFVDQVGALRTQLLEGINSLNLILEKQNDMELATRKRLEKDLLNAGFLIGSGGGGLHRFLLAKARKAPAIKISDKFN